MHQNFASNKYAEEHEVRLDWLGQGGRLLGKFSFKALKAGGVSRFIQHSYQPNVGITVVASPKDHKYPRLAVAALTDIEEGTQLVWDDVQLVASRAVKKKAKVEPVHVRETQTQPAMQSLGELVFKLRIAKAQAGSKGIYAILL